MSLAPANPLSNRFTNVGSTIAEELCHVSLGHHSMLRFQRIQKAERFAHHQHGRGIWFGFPRTMATQTFNRKRPFSDYPISQTGYKLLPLPSTLIPLDTFDHPSLRNKSPQASESYQAIESKSIPTPSIRPSHRLEADRIDFGFLDEDHQQQVISRAIDSPQLQSEIFEALDHKAV